LLAIGNLAHLALLVANGKLAEARELEGEAVVFDVGGQNGDNCCPRLRDNVIRFAIRTQVECFAHENCNNAASDLWAFWTLI
jgi:hypothetical protein